MGDLSIFKVDFKGLGEKLLMRVKDKEGQERLSVFWSKKLDRGQSLSLREGDKGEIGVSFGFETG